MTASSAASATETKVRWLLSDKAESVKKSIEGAIDKCLAGWRPGKDCSCEREEKEYGRGECPGCGDWDCCGECKEQNEYRGNNNGSDPHGGGMVSGPYTGNYQFPFGCRCGPCSDGPSSVAARW